MIIRPGRYLGYLYRGYQGGVRHVSAVNSIPATRIDQDQQQQCRYILISPDEIL